jgi:uncharacterized membrane protein
MSLDLTNLVAILCMAGVTYATRLSGFLIAHRLVLHGRMKAGFQAIPAAVLTAVIAPSVLATGWQETAAAAVTILAAMHLPLLATVAIGVGAIVLLRAATGS